MAKAYTTADTKTNFGWTLWGDVIDFMEENVDPDEIYDPETLLECLRENHGGLLEEEFENWSHE